MGLHLSACQESPDRSVTGLNVRNVDPQHKGNCIQDLLHHIPFERRVLAPEMLRPTIQHAFRHISEFRRKRRVLEQPEDLVGEATVPKDLQLVESATHARGTSKCQCPALAVW